MIEFLPAGHAVHRINASAQANLQAAQASQISRAFHSAEDFCHRVLDDLKLDLHLPHSLSDQPVTAVADLSFGDLREFWETLLLSAGVPTSGALLQAQALAERAQLVRAFDDPDGVLAWTTEKVADTTSRFPRTAQDIEQGSNPGDVLDPYILAATQILLYQDDFRQAIGATVAHKALMKLEDLLGHLHEEVLGRMRGNVKNVEPRGENQELYDAELNPFPGVDIIQPPLETGQPLRLHQVKSKTGTLNSSGGARLAEQMRQLRMRYRNAEIYSHSLVGTTLRGHRSMGTMLRSEPELIVTVGEEAFRILTYSEMGAELLLRVYQNAFRLSARRTGYSIESMSSTITEEFRAKSEAKGEGFLEVLLRDVTGGPKEFQNSRTYPRRALRQTVS